MKNILHRIKQLADNENIKITALEAKIGASKGVLSRPFRTGKDISTKWVISLVENYPQYNARWLLTGVGDMLGENTFSNEEKIQLLESKMALLEENKALVQEISDLKLVNAKLQNELANIINAKTTNPDNKQTA